MSFITGKPFVSELLDSLKATELKRLQTLIDTTNPTVAGNYQLYSTSGIAGVTLASILNVTGEFKYISLSYDPVMKGFFTGILIKLTNTEYGFISWRPDSKVMKTVDLFHTGAFNILPQELTTEEFRRVLGDALVSKGESVKVQIEDIEAPKVSNKVIYTDGNGGATWNEITGFQPVLTPESVSTNNDITTVIGFTAQGDLRKAKTPSDSLMQNFAPAYDATATYAVGDICTYGGAMYECNTAIETAEEWNSAHWTETDVSSLIPTGGGGSTQKYLHTVVLYASNGGYFITIQFVNDSSGERTTGNDQNLRQEVYNANLVGKTYLLYTLDSYADGNLRIQRRNRQDATISSINIASQLVVYCNVWQTYTDINLLDGTTVDSYTNENVNFAFHSETTIPL